MARHTRVSRRILPLQTGRPHFSFGLNWQTQLCVTTGRTHRPQLFVYHCGFVTVSCHYEMCFDVGRPSLVVRRKLVFVSLSLQNTTFVEQEYD